MSEEKTKDWAKWIPIVASLVALGLSAFSIWNQYQFEKWKDSRATPQLAAQYNGEHQDEPRYVEYWRCPVQPCQIFEPKPEGFERSSARHAIVIRNTSKTAVAAKVRVFIEVSCPFVVYGITCPGCEDGEYSHNKPKMGFTSPEDHRKIVLEFAELEIDTSREILVGVAFRKGEPCPKGAEEATIRIKMISEHRGRFLSGPVRLLE